MKTDIEYNFVTCKKRIDTHIGNTNIFEIMDQEFKSNEIYNKLKKCKSRQKFQKINKDS